MLRLLVVLLLLLNVGFADESKKVSPQTVVQEFYAFHFSHDMGFTEESVKQRSHWFTKDLQQKIRAYFAMPQNPDEPPIINGDPFTGTQEYPEKFTLGKVTKKKSSATTDITFHWKEGPERKAKAVLKNENGNWLIDDILFKDQESLRAMLTMEVK